MTLGKPGAAGHCRHGADYSSMIAAVKSERGFLHRQRQCCGLNEDRGQGRTNPFAAARGDKIAMRPDIFVVACYRGQFRCVAGGSCLSSYRHCNGRCDCPFCTDELNCYTPPSYPNITTPSTTLPSSHFISTYKHLFNYSKFAIFLDFPFFKYS